MNSFGITLPHQGRVSVAGAPFDGNASFRFALIDEGGSVVWNHEGGYSEPASDLTLEVIKGFYRCGLGDTTITGMSELPSSLFDVNNPLSLRIWFNDGTNGLQQLGDDQPLHVAPYALSSPRTGSELVSSQLGESLSSQASATGISVSELISRISLLATSTSPDGQILPSTLDPVLLLDLNRTRETEDIADGNITMKKLSSSLQDYLQPKFTSSPKLSSESKGIVHTGQSAVITIEVDGRNLSFQWQKDGVDLPDETNATLQILEANATLHNGSYTILASNAFGEVTSDPYLFEVNTTKVGSPYGDTFYVKSAANMELLWVQPGKFIMGSPSSEGGRFDDEIEHNVSITKGFYLGRFEVSQLEYLDVMANNLDDLYPRPSNFSDDSKPVEKVSWNDINSTFLPLLNQLESDNGNLPNGWKYFLPTEAEWEYACTANSSTVYSFGDSASPSLANYDNSYSSTTTAVGYFKANTLGFYDMHGNVAEWVQDWAHPDIQTTPQSYYTDENQTDPTGPGFGTNKILKGGAYSDAAQSLRSALRDFRTPDSRESKYGFRLALKKTE